MPDSEQQKGGLAGDFDRMFGTELPLGEETQQEVDTGRNFVTHLGLLGVEGLVEVCSAYGIPPEKAGEIVRRVAGTAFKALAGEIHPDKNPSGAENFMLINEAIRQVNSDTQHVIREAEGQAPNSLVERILADQAGVSHAQAQLEKARQEKAVLLSKQRYADMFNLDQEDHTEVAFEMAPQLFNSQVEDGELLEALPRVYLKRTKSGNLKLAGVDDEEDILVGSPTLLVKMGLDLVADRISVVSARFRIQLDEDGTVPQSILKRYTSDNTAYLEKAMVDMRRLFEGENGARIIGFIDREHDAPQSESTSLRLGRGTLPGQTADLVRFKPEAYKYIDTLAVDYPDGLYSSATNGKQVVVSLSPMSNAQGLLVGQAGVFSGL